MQQTVSAKKRKAIFVDGLSAHKMKPHLGIDLVNFVGLYRVLLYKVGTCRELNSLPMITVNPEYCDGGIGLVKQLTGAGFRAVPADSSRSEDDDIIKEHISRLDPDVVEEIVICGSDRDYVPELLVKASQGITIYWVATKYSCRDDINEDLSPSLLDHFDSGSFRFFELFECRRDICCGHLERFGQSGKSAPLPPIDFKMKYRGSDVKERICLREDLLRLERKYPGLRFELPR